MSETATAETPVVSAPKAKKARSKPSKNGNGHPKLRSTQLRMLKLLSKKELATRQQLVVAACPGRENPQLDGTHLGNINPKNRAYEKTKGYPSLLTLGYVRHKIIRIIEPPHKDTHENWYEITAAGRKALKALKALEAAK